MSHRLCEWNSLKFSSIEIEFACVGNVSLAYGSTVGDSLDSVEAY